MTVLRTGLLVAKRFFNERFYDHSAQMAYYFLLSMFPFLIFVFTLIGFLPIEAHGLLEMLQPYIPEGSYYILENTLLSIMNNQQKKLASFSFIATFWLSSMAVQSMVRSMNDAYRMKRKESFLKGLLFDLFLTAGLIAIFSFSIFIPIVEEIARIFVITHVSVPTSFYFWWLFVKWGMGTFFLFLFFLFLYKFFPTEKVSYRSALPGALFATIGWQGAAFAFTYYVSFGSYSQLYGQLGSVIVLIVWFYLTAAVLLIGGLINGTMNEMIK